MGDFRGAEIDALVARLDRYYRSGSEIFSRSPVTEAAAAILAIQADLAAAQERIAALTEALVWAADAPMIETMRSLEASDDAIKAAVINHLGSMPAHYDDTLTRARVAALTTGARKDG